VPFDKTKMRQPGRERKRIPTKGSRDYIDFCNKMQVVGLGKRAFALFANAIQEIKGYRQKKF
jgi:hypothetical protein